MNIRDRRDVHADALWLTQLARGVDVPSDMVPGVEKAADRVVNIYANPAGRALRESMTVADERVLDGYIVFMAKLARGSSWPGSMAEQVERAAARVIEAHSAAR